VFGWKEYSALKCLHHWDVDVSLVFLIAFHMWFSQIVTNRLYLLEMLLTYIVRCIFCYKVKLLRHCKFRNNWLSLRFFHLFNYTVLAWRSGLPSGQLSYQLVGSISGVRSKSRHTCWPIVNWKRDLRSTLFRCKRVVQDFGGTQSSVTIDESWNWNSSRWKLWEVSYLLWGDAK